MPEKNRFQYHLATGKALFPAAIISCLAVTGVSFGELTDLLPLMAIGLTTYLLIELNTSFSLIRTRTTLHASLFLLFYVSCPFLHTYSHDIWITPLFVAGIYFLFQSYESPYASTPVFHSFLCLGLGSMIFPWLLYLIPFIYLFMVNLRSFNARTFFAGIIGTTLPYWFLLCWYLYTGEAEKTFQPFIRLAHPPVIGYGTLSLSQIVTIGTLTVLTAICSIQVVMQGYKDKVQTRIMLRIIIMAGVISVMLAALLPSHINAAVTMLLVVYAIMGGHLFALTFNRFTGILSWATLGIWFLVTSFNLWTDSFNF